MYPHSKQIAKTKEEGGVMVEKALIAVGAVVNYTTPDLQTSNCVRS